ncbi:MAG: carbon storage regulator CsrA [Ruminococcaceae bacterium]|mgnify:CR=1 FL=1|nr:carbon storage regulator CsrA [Oscillospiraceae bacterium]
MLILTRKPGQGFTIGDDIEITITEVSGDKVRVGISAPKAVKILRSELTQTVEQNQQAAEKTDVKALRALALGLHRGEKPPEAPEEK